MSLPARRVLMLVIIVLGTASYYLFFSKPPEAMTAPETDGVKMELMKPSPQFSYVTIDGKKISLADYVGKKTVVIDFWATWCGPCLKELPLLEALYKTHSNEIEIIAITSEDATVGDAVAKKIAERGITFPVLHDPSKKIAEMFPHSRIPYLILIDKNGIVVQTFVGENPDIAEKVRATFGMN